MAIVFLAGGFQGVYFSFRLLIQVCAFLIMLKALMILFSMNTQIQLLLFLLPFESLSLKVCIIKYCPLNFHNFYLRLASFSLFSNNFNQFASFYS